MLIIVHHIADDAEPDTPKATPKKAAIVKKGTAVVKKKGTAVVVKKRARAFEAEDDSDDESQIRHLGRKKARKGPPRRIMLDDGPEGGDGDLPNDEGED